ncbi:MAG: hypothetical protein ACLFRV_14095, partial [Acidimicrobiales bacterium]
MRATRNHLIRAFTVLAAVLVFGAGIAVAAENTVTADESDDGDVEVLAEETHGAVVSEAAQDHSNDEE